MTLLQNYYDEYKKLSKCFNNRIKVQTYKDKLTVFLGHSKKLFDFAHCKCDSLTTVFVLKTKKFPSLNDHEDVMKSFRCRILQEVMKMIP